MRPNKGKQKVIYNNYNGYKYIQKNKNLRNNKTMLKSMHSGCYKPYVLALTLLLINDLQQVTYSLSTSDDSSIKG